jgi:hypothetical protein
MAAKSNPLDELLHQYGKFWHDKDLAVEKQRPYLMRQVRDFLHYAQKHPHVVPQLRDSSFAEGSGDP